MMAPATPQRVPHAARRVALPWASEHFLGDPSSPDCRPVEAGRAVDEPASPAASPSLDVRIFEAAVASLELLSVHLGRRLGLYEAMAALEGVTVEELAKAAGIAPGYAQEWLEQQAVAGIPAGTRERRPAGRQQTRALTPSSFMIGEDPSV